MANSTVKTVESLDTGSAAKSCEAIELSKGIIAIGILVKQLSGDLTGLILSVEFSDDGVEWYPSAQSCPIRTVSGNFSFIVVNPSYDYMRLCVATKSTDASTAKLTLQTK